MKTLPVHSIFESISGEAGLIPQGSWVTFIRLQGCNLRCLYCDTKETQNLEAKARLEISSIVSKVYTDKVIITGGEPLIHDNLESLILALQKAGKIVQIETNGTRPLIPTKYNCFWVVDVKGPSSGTNAPKIPIDEFVRQLNTNDTILKFVIIDDQDMYFALDKIHELSNAGYDGQFILSPVDAKHELTGVLFPILRIFLPPTIMNKIILSLQIHKICKLA